MKTFIRDLLFLPASLLVWFFLFEVTPDPVPPILDLVLSTLLVVYIVVTIYKLYRIFRYLLAKKKS